MSISKRQNVREQSQTYIFYSCFFVKYLNHLEKDFDTNNTGDYKGFKKSGCLDQAKTLKTRHFLQSYLFECHPKTFR